MKTLVIDEKWSVEYDPANNDRPTRLLRNGEVYPLPPSTWNNDQVAMFYALLEARGEEAVLVPKPERSAEMPEKIYVWPEGSDFEYATEWRPSAGPCAEYVRRKVVPDATILESPVYLQGDAAHAWVSGYNAALLALGVTDDAS